MDCTAAPTLFSAEFPVGSKFRCVLTIAQPAPDAQAEPVIRWEPRNPHRLSSAHLADYRAGRAKAMADFAASLAAPTTRTPGAGQGEHN